MRLTPKQKEISQIIDSEGHFTATESHNGRCVRGVREVQTGLRLVALGLATYQMERKSDAIGYSDYYTFYKIQQPTTTMPDPQIQVRLDHLRLKESIAQYGDPAAFLSDVSNILRELGNDTKHRAANLAEKDPLLEMWAERDLHYSDAIVEMIDSVNDEN